METAAMRPEPKAAQVPDLEEAGRSPLEPLKTVVSRIWGFRPPEPENPIPAVLRQLAVATSNNPALPLGAQEETQAELHAVVLGC